MKFNPNKLLQALAYAAGAYILYLLLKPHLNFLYYPFYDTAINGFGDTKPILDYNVLPLNMFITFTVIAGIRSLIVNPGGSNPVRTGVSYFLLGMFEAFVAWGLSYIICFFSVLGEASGYLRFMAKYIPFITKSSVIAGTVVGIVCAILIFLSIPIIILVAIIASTATVIMIPIAIVLGILLVVLVYIIKFLYLGISWCDGLILKICE